MKKQKNKLPVVDKNDFPYELAMVYWEDIVGESGWSDITEIKKSTTAICCSFGWLVKNNDNTTVVMSDFIFEDNNKIKTGGGYNTIPTKNVLKIIKIKT